MTDGQTGRGAAAIWIVAALVTGTALAQEEIFVDRAVEQGVDFLQFGRSIVDLNAVKQIAESDQARSIGFILYYSKLRYMDEGYPLREILDLVDRDLSNEGLNALVRDVRGDLSKFSDSSGIAIAITSHGARERSYCLLLCADHQHSV